MCSSTVEAFIECIDDLSYIRKGEEEYSIGIQDIVIWTGAGFSKAWDKNFPLNEKLFFLGTLESIESAKYPNLRQYISSVLGWSLKKEIDFDFIKMLNYRLSVQQAYPELQNRYMDQQLAEKIQNELSLWVFQKIQLLLEGKTDTREKGNIHRFFNYLSHQSTTSYKGGAGFRLNFISTNYDFCIENALGLGKEDEEYFLYRGFSPVRNNGHSINNLQIEDDPHISLLKLNGGLEIIEDGGKYSIDYCLETLASYYSDIHRKKSLILPNHEQDYSSPYYRMIFPKAVELLRKAKFLLFLGTSLPDEDVLFKHLLSHFAEQEADYYKKYVFCISKEPKKETEIIKERILATFPQYEKIVDHVFMYSKGLDSFIDDFVKINTEMHPLESNWKGWWDQ